MPKEKRQCPGFGCSIMVADPKFLCSTHWFRVPKALRDLIWRLYRSERDSDAHVAAVSSAIRGVMRRPAA